MSLHAAMKFCISCSEFGINAALLPCIHHIKYS